MVVMVIGALISGFNKGVSDMLEQSGPKTFWKGWMSFLVGPTDTATTLQAMEDVTVALRVARGLRPGQENNFAVVSQEKFLESVNSTTLVLRVVMIVLSMVGLAVGGVGVVAIMMISVTERTREIGVRKALGARRREILWQFLVEAATLTLAGGVCGMIAGGVVALLIATTPPAIMPHTPPARRSEEHTSELQSLAYL